MRFLYKIHSNYDGFRPGVLPERMEDGRLRLRWHHYIDVVEMGWECWVYFHGRHKFENGVYAEGIVDGIDLKTGEVSLRVREHRTDRPITSRRTSARIAGAVAPRYRQVFLWPDDWTVAPECAPKACTARQCGDCETWRKLPLIGERESSTPRRLRWSTYEAVVAAHWIVPRRCYETRIRTEVRDLTMRFTAFKLGEMAYAYPFALSMFEQLRQRELLNFDYVVPIPLSPDKAESGEKHRTRELGRELGHLLVVRMREMLSLSSSVSKRRMQAAGYTVSQFEADYSAALKATVPADARRILLVDDVMTRGSTVAQAIRAIHEQRREAVVVVATAGQMIIKESVVDDSGFAASA